MEEVGEADGIELRIRIAAAPEVVFGFFEDPERFAAWMGDGSTMVARPGGAVVVEYPGEAAPAMGKVLETVPNRRIVFTWGYEGGANGLPPGSSTVSVDLQPTDTGTLLTLRHVGLDDDDLEQGHLGGWRHYFGVLAWRASRVALAPVLEERVDAWVSAWNEPDPDVRRDQLSECWTAGALFADRMGYVEGIEAMDSFIANAHRFLPGVRMERTGPVREMHGTICFPWRLGRGEEVVGAGSSVGRVDARGRIVELIGFWESLDGG